MLPKSRTLTGAGKVEKRNESNRDPI